MLDPGLSEEIKAHVLEDLRKVKPAAVVKYLKIAANAEKQIMEASRTSDFLDQLAKEELLCGLRGEMLVHETVAAMLKYPDFAPRETADRLRAFETRFAALWHKRNKPSEYYRIRELLMKAADRLDSMDA